MSPCTAEYMFATAATATASVAVIWENPHCGRSGHACGYRSMYPIQIGYWCPFHQAVTRTGVSSRTSPVCTMFGPATSAASAR